ncbi:MAG: transporter related [Clostridiales bacterium]|jgi:ABC-2 type transport system ATP-binding protein|nr:transporter related [Clostridiales bacterium]
MDKVFEFNHVSMVWPDFSIKDVNFSLEKGYIMGLVGYNGAGKTTLFRLMANQYKRYEGEILIGGYDCRTQEAKVKDITAFISDDQNFFFEESVLKNAEIYSCYYSNWDEDTFQKYLDRFEISTRTKIIDLSRGTFLKFQLAFAAAHHPILYAMDEPTAGFDPVFRYDFLKIIQEIVAEENASILFSTHNTSDLDKVADYITMLDNGRVIFSKDVETLFDEYQNNTDEKLRFSISNLFKKGRWNK